MKRGVIFCIIFILLSCSVMAATFEEKRAAYIVSYGEGLSDELGIWAYLENPLNEYTEEYITYQIRQWGHDGSPDPNIPEKDWPADWGQGMWTAGWFLPRLHLLRVHLQYPDQVSDELYWMNNNWKYFKIPDISGFTMNNRLMLHTIGFLVAEMRGESTSESKSWLFDTFNQLAKEGDYTRELDSEYTKTFVDSLYTLYDFAQDPEMKKRAKMMLDLILLDSVLDVCMDMHGGHVGRTYARTIWSGGPEIYHWIYWDIGSMPFSSRGRFYTALVSTYRLPDLIFDIGNLDDEPDSYWHFNMENNLAGHPTYVRGDGKWIYVTKYFTMGGSLQASMMDVEGLIRLWIDNKPTVEEGCSNSECYQEIGRGCYQYKNAMLIEYAPNLHIIDISTQTAYDENEGAALFDESDSNGGWHFYKKDHTAIAIYLSGQVSAIEAAVIGADYPTFQAFKDAVSANAQVSSGSFTTSKGVTITKSGDSGSTSGASDSAVLNLPVKRIETVSSDGPIVTWNNNVMTVQKHGKSCTYDFNSWSMSGDSCEGDVGPPPERKTCSDWDSSAFCCESGQTCEGNIYYFASDCSYPTTCCKGTCKTPVNCDTDCGSWTLDTDCGGGDCPSTMVQQTRTCSTSECPTTLCTPHLGCAGDDTGNGDGNDNDDPADINDDDVIDIFDLVLLVRAFGTSEHDLDGDGIVNVSDLLIIVGKL